MKCARCGGYVVTEHGEDGVEYVCLQCGARPRITQLGEFYARKPGNISKFSRERKVTK